MALAVSQGLGWWQGVQCVCTMVLVLESMGHLLCAVESSPTTRRFVWGDWPVWI